MVTNLSMLLIFVTLSAVTAQTFQYSRGWTNGKRDGHKRSEDLREISSNLERILSPCQMNKLKYLLEGKPISERVLASCDYPEDDDNQPKRYKHDRNADLFDTFQ